MSEFEFLKAQFFRLSDATRLRQKNEEKLNAQEKKVPTINPFELAEIWIKNGIEDYLKMRGASHE